MTMNRAALSLSLLLSALALAEEPAKPTIAPGDELAALTAEYNAITDQLFRSRAKVSLVGDALFKSRIEARFRYGAQRAWPLERVTMRIDDLPVYTGETPSATETIKIFDGFAVPGKHTLSLEVEARATGEARVAYGTEGHFTFDLPDGKQTLVEFVVDETGSGAHPLAQRNRGDFDVRVRAKVKTLELPRK